MASSINADNGVVSGSSGLKSTADTSGVLALQSNGSTGVTLDTSLNVGIGTTSPASKLDVAGITRTSNTTGNKVFYLGQSTPSGNDGASLEFQNSNAQTNWAIRTNWNIGGALEFCPSSAAGGTSYTTPSMAINSSGNLGLGVTPSAWGSNYKAMQFGAQGSIHTYVGVSMSMAANAYDSGAGAWKYIANNYACRFTQDPSNGQSVWQNAPLGTAGAALTWTTSLSINNSGAIGVGSSPSYGTSGQVLTSGGSGAAPTWSTPSSGAMVYITSVTASGASSIDLTTGIDSTYDQYVLVGQSIQPSSGAAILYTRFYIGGSVNSSAAYGFQASYLSGGAWSGALSGSSQNQGSMFGSGINYANTAFNFNFTGYINQPASTSTFKMMYWMGTGVTGVGGDSRPYMGTVGFGSAGTAMTGIQLYPSTGTISGTLRLYGIKNS